METDLLEPRIDPSLANGSVAIQSDGHLLQFRIDPADDFQEVLVLGIQITPADDPFISESAGGMVWAKLFTAFPARRWSRFWICISRMLRLQPWVRACRM